ncbi:MAG TPA: Hpt domain-containing protein [Gemmatimonadaceae bacterium]|nr:Hpt domain-containing protein [Gemmatimonadaceae bacterium]
MAAPSSVNTSALDVLECVGGETLVWQLIALYRGYVPARRAEARAAWAAGDLAGVRRACQALRSGSAQLGLDAVVHWCTECEARALAGDGATLGGLLDALEAASDEALHWLATRSRHAAA